MDILDLVNRTSGVNLEVVNLNTHQYSIEMQVAGMPRKARVAFEKDTKFDTAVQETVNYFIARSAEKED